MPLDVDAGADGICLGCQILQQPFGAFMYLKIAFLSGVVKIFFTDFWYRVALCPLIDKPGC